MCSMQTFWNFHIKYKRCYLQPFAFMAFLQKCVFFKYHSLQKHESRKLEKTGRCNLILTVGNSYMFFNTENKCVYEGLNVMKGNYRIKSIHLTCHPPGFFYTKTSAATFGIF